MVRKHHKKRIQKPVSFQQLEGEVDILNADGMEIEPAINQVAKKHNLTRPETDELKIRFGVSTGESETEIFFED